MTPASTSNEEMKCMTNQTPRRVPLLETTGPLSFQTWRKNFTKFAAEQRYDTSTSKRVAKAALVKEAAILANDVNTLEGNDMFTLDDFMATLGERFFDVRYLFHRLRQGDPKLTWWAVLTAVHVRGSFGLITDEECRRLTASLTEEPPCLSSEYLVRPDRKPLSEGRSTDADRGEPGVGLMDFPALPTATQPICWFQPCRGSHVAAQCPQLQQARVLLQKLEQVKHKRRGKPNKAKANLVSEATSTSTTSPAVTSTATIPAFTIEVKKKPAVGTVESTD